MERVLTAAVAALAFLWASQAAAADLSIEVQGVAGSAGQVLVALHSNSDSFPSGWSEAVAVERVPAGGPLIVVRFPNVPPGRYAVMVVHDADGNGRMTKTWIGLPLEGFGASNNPGAFGPPRFREAAFDFTGDRTVLIRVVYL